MSLLDKINPANDGLVPAMMGTVETVGALYVYGRVQNHFRERASVMGAPLDLVAGGVLKAGEIVLRLWGGKGKTVKNLLPHVSILGTAGLGAFAHTFGAGHGAQTSGVTRVIADKKDLPKIKAAAPGVAVVGDLGKAPHGAFLSEQQLAEMSR